MSVWRSRWAAIGAAIAVSLGGGGIGLVSAGVSTGDRPVTVTIEPERILDTRVDLGLSGRFVNGTPRNLQVTGVVPIAPSGTATVVPGDAVAVLVNVTVVVPDSPGFLALRPGGASGVPSTSNVNWLTAGAIEPNAATVDLGPGGTIQVYVKTASPTGSAHVLVDVVGYTIGHDHDDRYYTEPEVDALIAGLGGDDYQNVIVVARSGGHFTSVGAAVDAIGSDPGYPAASASNRYLVWVAPGVYQDEDIDMQPYVDIEGSGQGVTVLRSVGGANGITPDAATLVGADDAELRDLTVEIEASGASVWAYGIYTAGTTRFHRVTAAGTGGSRARGMVVDNGGAPVLIDVILRASDASVSNLGLDVVLATALVDGLFADASGGNVANAIFVNTASSEVLMENVTAQASGATNEVTGLKTNESSVTVEGLRSIATGSPSSSATAVWCDDENRTMRVVGAPTIFAENSGSGAARGVFGSDCNLELRDAVVDAVSASGSARAVQHVQNDGGQAADVTISDVEARASSATSNAIGMNLTGGGIGTFGRVSDTNLRATGGSASSSTAGIIHGAAGEVQYRGLSLIVEGAAGFMYGIQADGTGVPRFDDVVVDAVGEAAATVFGVELLTDSSSLTNARVRAINTASGDFHDAVGVKANNATDVAFTDVIAYAEAETNVWGVDVTNAGARLTRVDARAVGNPGGIAFGARCGSGSIEVHDSVLTAGPAGSVAYGVLAFDCGGTVTGSEMVGVPGAGFSYGFFSQVNTGTPTNEVRDSYLSGQTATVFSQTNADVTVVGSELDGAAAGTSGASAALACTAVTFNSGGVEAFQAANGACP